LDKHFHPPKRLEIEIDLARLGYQHLGISPNVSLDRVRSQYLKPAIEELESVGYLMPDHRTAVFRKLRRGVWHCHFRRAMRGKTKRTETNALEKQLRKLGCSQGVAKLLPTQHSTKTITCAIAAMKEQLGKGREIRSPDAWLRSAIQDGYQPTPGPGRLSRPELRIFQAGKFFDR
jgi:hypothetical protein